MMSLDGVEMVDVREAARLTRRTPETIRRWVWSGRIAARKQGNRLFLPRAEVVKLVAGERDGPGAPMAWSEWTEWVMRDRRGAQGATAAELVLDDRARR